MSKRGTENIKELHTTLLNYWEHEMTDNTINIAKKFRVRQKNSVIISKLWFREVGEPLVNYFFRK